MCQGDEERNTADWYRLLNCGFKCPISAGTDSAPQHSLSPDSRSRTGLCSDGAEAKLRGLDRRIQAGAKFRHQCSPAPLQRERERSGGEIHWQSGSLELKVRAEATSHVPMERMDLVVNGRVMASQKAEREGNPDPNAGKSHDRRQLMGGGACPGKSPQAASQRQKLFMPTAAPSTVTVQERNPLQGRRPVFSSNRLTG